MEIHEKLIRDLAGPHTGDGDVKVSLFIVSAKYPRLKKLDLADLSPDERLRKLNKWAEQHRFVALIEKGDQAFAHLSAEHAKRLQPSEDITIDGKSRNVAVTSLTDEDYEQLAAVGEAFKQYVKEQNEEEKTEKSADLDSYRSEARQFFSTHKLVSDQMHMDYLIASMQNLPSKVILNFLRRWSEAQREEAKQQEDTQKRQTIKDGIIHKEITNHEIGRQQLADDAKRVNRIRTE